MYYRLREFDREESCCRKLNVKTLEQIVPMEMIQDCLRDMKASHIRERKLRMEMVILTIILMNIYAWLPIQAVLQKLLMGLCLVGGSLPSSLPGASALVYRRQQLGLRPMVELFRRLCQPMALSQTKGAFIFGLRIMALDGHVESVPDTPENRAYFGKHRSGRGESVYPQLQAVYLCEAGTRAVIDAGFWPRHTGEHVGALRLMRSVKKGMLLTWDRGLHNYLLVREVLDRGAHMLARIPSSLKPRRIAKLPDGSFIGWIYPTNRMKKALRNRGLLRDKERLLVRFVEYTITDPALPGYGEVHRLMTTLVEYRLYPAKELVCAYHERWEIETTIAETSTYQRLCRKPLRSRTPLGVLQEMYGLLIGHYIIRSVMHQAALEAEMDPDRVSFSHAVHVISEALPLLVMASMLNTKSSEWTNGIMDVLRKDLVHHPLPKRKMRSVPRVVKQQTRSWFPARRQMHSNPPKPSAPFRLSIAIVFRPA